MGSGEVSPTVFAEADGKDGTGGHIVYSDLGEGVGELGDTGVVRKDDDGVFAVGDGGDGISKGLNCWLVEVVYKLDVVSFIMKLVGKKAGGAGGTFGGAGNEEVGDDVFVSDALSHFGCVFFSSLVEGAIEVILDVCVPRAFCMSNEEECFHEAKLAPRALFQSCPEPLKGNPPTPEGEFEV